MNIDNLWKEFLEDFWSRQCCPHPCINFQDSDENFLEGAEAFYRFIQEKHGKDMSFFEGWEFFQGSARTPNTTLK